MPGKEIKVDLNLLRPREGLFRKFLESRLSPEERVQKRLGNNVSLMIKEGRVYKNQVREEQIKKGERKSGVIYLKDK